jgi:hypothetical protein
MRKQITPIILTALITALIVGGGEYWFLSRPNRLSPDARTAPIPEIAVAKSAAEDKLFDENSYYAEGLEARIMSDGIEYASVEPLNCANLKKLEILYGDLTGDAEDEAVVAIPSGGIAGNLVVLIYSVVNKKVALIDKIEGYKMNPSIENNQLIIQTPFYLKTDANCCPSSFDITTYSWNGKKFVISETKRVTFDEINSK